MKKTKPAPRSEQITLRDIGDWADGKRPDLGWPLEFMPAGTAARAERMESRLAEVEVLLGKADVLLDRMLPDARLGASRRRSQIQFAQQHAKDRASAARGARMEAQARAAKLRQENSHLSDTDIAKLLHQEPQFAARSVRTLRGYLSAKG